MFLLWIGLIALLVWGFVVWSRDGHIHLGPRQTRPDPIDIARERYARGEITREEFETIKHDLES